MGCSRTQETEDFLNKPYYTRQLFEAFPGTGRFSIASGWSRAGLEYVHCRLLPIPGMVDDYNHYE